MQTKTNKFFIVTLGILTIALLYVLAPILTPFLAAALIAYLANPLVEKLIHWHLPRLLSVIIVFLFLFTVIILLILLLIPLIHGQITMLLDLVPSIISWTQDKVLPWLNANFGSVETINLETVKTTLADNWTKASGAATWILKTIFKSGMTLVLWVTDLVLIPVVTFYLLRDWRKILKNIQSLLPRHIEPTVVKLAKECDSVLSAFFRGQLLVMLSLGIIYSIGLSLMGLRVGLIIGLIAGLMSIVPYLGFIVGIVSASVAAYIQFGTTTSVLLVCVVFAVGQMLESTFLTPKLVGSRIGLHPVAVIFAALTGAFLFGFFGVLLALPVAAVIMVLLRFLNQRYRNSQLYKS